MDDVKRWCSWTAEDDLFAAACRRQPTRYVNTDLGAESNGEIVVRGETFQTLCDTHDTTARRQPGFRWSRPLGLLGGDGAGD